MKKNYYFLFLLLYSPLVFAQMQVPGKKQDSLIVLMNGRAHIGNGQVIENSALGFENGKIVFIGDATTMRLDLSHAKVIDVYGKEIYPGLITANSSLGLSEIELARSTNDFFEVGQFNPCVRALIAYNTDSKIIPTTRSNGVLLAQVVPQGGIISGQSSIVQLDAWNWEDAAYKTDEGIHLNWPSYFRYQIDVNGNGSMSKSTSYYSDIDVIKKYFQDAQAYCSVSHLKKDIQSEAMCGLFNQTKSLYIHAQLAAEIQAAVLFAQDFHLKAVIVGGQEAWKCIPLLKEKNIPVILNRNQSLPPSPDSDYDICYKTPYLLETSNVLYCNSLDLFWQERNLPFNASEPVAYGLSEENALKSVTLNAARILGIEQVTGTLETGKDANIVVSDGDILDIKSNKVIYAFIQGRSVDLNNKQKELYKIYMTKYGLNK